MKGRILALIFLFNFTSFLSLNAQWARTYGTSEDECAYSICQTSDGGYIVAGGAGYTYFTGSTHREDYDFWILKLRSSGEIEWQQTYGGSDSENGYSIQQTSEGGYIVIGSINSFGAGLSDFWILKLSLVGDIEWQKTYGGSQSEEPFSIRQTSDGGYIVAGSTESFGAGNGDIWILKLASDGTVEWQKTYGGSDNEITYSIQQTSDGGYIVAGIGSGDFLVLKLASDGTIEWQKTYGGSESEIAHSIQQTSDGGYIVAGSTDTYGAGKGDFLILKLFSNGNIDPACRFIKESNVEVSDAGISPADTYITPEDTNIVPQDTDITPQESAALTYILCSGEHTLSLSATSGGTTVPQPGTYIYDHAVRISIKAYPDEEANFTGWSGDASGTDQLLSVTVDSDKSIKANFSGIVDVWEEVKKSPCFIATAAYGSPLHPHVRILRDFRDKFLISNELGREFVELYYKFSPFVADLIAKHKALKVIVQINLFPLIVFSYSMIHFGPIITAGVLAFVFVLSIFLILFYRKKLMQLEAKTSKSLPSLDWIRR